MSASLARSLRVVLYEGVGSRSIPDADRFAMIATLRQGGYAVTSVRAGSRTAPEGARTPIVVLGRFESAPPREAESDSLAAPIFFRDIEGVDAPAIASVVESVHAEAGTGRPGGWKPWFPVIDFGRCTNCMQCLTFCLFDVYGVSPDKQIRLQNPSNCNTYCPARPHAFPEGHV